MSSPSVSIVTPSYNQGRFIEETLDSVSNQTYSNIEHIVVDGGSTDSTVDILAQRDGIEWISEADEGQSDAINKGIELAGGDIIGWLNSDDVYFDTEVVGRVVRYFDRTDADVLFGDVALIGPQSTILSIQVVPDFDSDRLLRGCFIEQPAVFFKAPVLEGARLNESLEYVMDYELWLRLSQEHEFRHMPDVLAADRNHAGRKIIADRNEMHAEARELQTRYGNDHGPADRLERVADLLFDGIPRTGDAMLRGIQLREESPNLAFDGTFPPISRLLLNTVRLNKNLVPDTAVHSGSR